MAQCGLVNQEIGNTYLADRLNLDGSVIQSALDHIYISTELEKTTKCGKLPDSSTDHVPIMLDIQANTKTLQ